MRYSEIEFQLSQLQQAHEQVHSLDRLSVRQGKIIVYDTNSLMHYQDPQSIVWTEILSGAVRLVVPLIVLDELDHKRYSGTPKMAERARTAQRKLAALLADVSAGDKVNVPGRPGVTFEVFLDEPGHRRLQSADDEIVERTLLLQQLGDSPVTLLTHDIGMRLRAQAVGLLTLQLPESAAKPDDTVPASE